MFERVETVIKRLTRSIWGICHKTIAHRDLQQPRGPHETTLVRIAAPLMQEESQAHICSEDNGRSGVKGLSAGRRPSLYTGDNAYNVGAARRPLVYQGPPEHSVRRTPSRGNLLGVPGAVKTHDGRLNWGT